MGDLIGRLHSQQSFGKSLVKHCGASQVATGQREVDHVIPHLNEKKRRVSSDGNLAELRVANLIGLLECVRQVCPIPLQDFPPFSECFVSTFYQMNI